jgi:hypothetical protein
VNIVTWIVLGASIAIGVIIARTAGKGVCDSAVAVDSFSASLGSRSHAARQRVSKHDCGATGLVRSAALARID